MAEICLAFEDNLETQLKIPPKFQPNQSSSLLDCSLLLKLNKKSQIKTAIVLSVSFFALLGVLHRVARAHEADVGGIGDWKQAHGGGAPAETAEEE